MRRIPIRGDLIRVRAVEHELLVVDSQQTSINSQAVAVCQCIAVDIVDYQYVIAPLTPVTQLIVDIVGSSHTKMDHITLLANVKFTVSSTNQYTIKQVKEV